MADTLTIDITDLPPADVARILVSVASIRAGRIAPGAYRADDGTDEPWRTAELTGWTLEHVRLLRERLRSRGKREELAVFDTAIADGGFVSRTRVFEISGWDPDKRRLNGFRTPFDKAREELIEEQQLPADAALPIFAEYTDNPGYQKTQGYTVAGEIVRLVREADEQEQPTR